MKKVKEEKAATKKKAEEAKPKGKSGKGKR